MSKVEVEKLVSEEDVDEALEAIYKAGKPIRAKMDVLVAAANGPRRGLSGIVGEFLGALAEEMDDVKKEVLALSKSPRMNGRMASLLALSHIQDRRLSRSIVEKCLADRSAKVKEYASYVALNKRLIEVEPLLNQAIETEEKDSVRNSLRFHRGLLVDGYYIGEGIEDGEVSVTASLPSGGSVTSFISQANLDEVGIDSFVADLLSRWKE